MGFIIEDGAGTGQTAQVKNNKLQVSAVVSTQEHFANHNQGVGFNLLFSATPTAAGDCFLYIKNENPTLALSIEGFWLKDASDEYIEIKLNDIGTPLADTDITPVNLNTASGSQALGVFKSGADITGLDGGVNAFKIYNKSSVESVYRNFNMDVVLGSNGVLTMYAGTGTTPIEGMIVFNYHGTNN